MRLSCLLTSILLIMSFNPGKEDKHIARQIVPELIIPQYDKLKDMHSEIKLVSDGIPYSAIATSVDYLPAAKELQSEIKKLTGIKLPVIPDTDEKAVIPFSTNLIILGNRSTSKVSSELYDRFYSLMDLKYPGKNGYSVRSLHNPFGNGYSAVLIGGSDKEGVVSGIKAFIDHLKILPKVAEGNLSTGWTMLTKLGDGVVIPSDIREFETWEASRGYRSLGYFGWNSISKRMAMYYMTGDSHHAREVIRLSFPNEQAFREIEEIDGERIENKNDPLAGPYHYNATMTILFWDIIEESPVFTDDERLNVTNAFARRLNHEGTTPFDKNTYKLNSVPSGVGSRHGQWSALSLYTLGRYFNKDYPSPVWAQAERAGKLSFASLHEHAFVSGESDKLDWYCTGIAPVLTYMILSGDRKPLENGVLQELLRGQEILISGLVPDANLNSAALDFLNKAAYLTKDGRWITYRERTGLNTDIFRLGQSFWPEDHIKPSLPEDLTGKWTLNPMPEQMWKRRNNNFTLQQSFQNMSYRSTADSSGDFILLKGYNGAYRNPYHTFSIIELRLNGETLLKGFNNQVLTSADGMVEPTVAMDAALLDYDVTGDVAYAAFRVPNLPYTDWKRTLMHSTGKYSLIVDDLTFRSGNPENKESETVIRVETNWETPLKSWSRKMNNAGTKTGNDNNTTGLVQPQKTNYIEIQPDGFFSHNKYELHVSDCMLITGDRNISMIWSEPVKDGQNSKFFYLLGRNNSKSSGRLACLKLSENAAALSLPEPAVVVAGDYKNNKAELLVLSASSLYGNLITRAGLSNYLLETDSPINVNWDFDIGKMELTNTKPVKLFLAVKSLKLILNGKNIKGRKMNGNIIFNIPEGKNKIEGAVLPTDVKESLISALSDLTAQAERTRADQIEKDIPAARKPAPGFIQRIQTTFPGNPTDATIINSDKGDLLCAAFNNTIVILDSSGKKTTHITTPSNIRVLHWWADHNILLAGCIDEKVIAFDIQGEKKWEFTSLMDSAVYEAGKPYWFKSVYPGIYGLYSGIFDNGKSRAFIGSACTLEILNENGQLVKRTPVFWGPGRQFLMIDAPDGSKNLLIGRWENDWPTFVVISSKTLSEESRGYNGVPPGHTFVNGWTAMNRYDNFLTDLTGDGKKEIVSAINGTWNRITVYNEDGKPLFNAQIGPGVSGERTNIRMMDVGDIDEDGKQEIVVGLSSGFLNTLDDKTRKIWSELLPDSPTVVKIVNEHDFSWICAGCEDGTILALDKKGNIIREGKVKGRPNMIKSIKGVDGPITVILTDQGEISSFQLN